MKSTLQTINDLAEKSPKELVMRAERHYLNEISAAADRIAQNKSIKVIAIAGPSSSGKTTTAHMLREALAKQGIKTDVVSLDDFYLPQETLPLLPDGTRDIESVNALDIPLINKCFNEALMTGKAALPKFDFLKKIRIENAHELDISGNSIVIAEGLHALNPVLTEKFTQEQVCPAAVYGTKEEFRKNAYALFDKNLLYTPWNKLYLSSYILENKLYFPQTFWDDFPFNLSVVRDVERVSVLSDKFYHFIRKRAESETAKYRSDMYDKREEENGWMEELFAYWGVDTPEVREFLARRYIERIIGCVENVTNRNCPLSAKEKKAEIKRIISTDRVKNAVKTAKPNSKYMKIMLLPIKWNNAGLTYMEGGVISKVKSGNTKTFAKLKAGR